MLFHDFPFSGCVAEQWKIICGGNVRGNMAMAATVPFCSCLHREAYVKAVTAESLAGAEDGAFGSA